MNEQRIEEKLRSFLNSEVKEVEPSPQWWDNVISRVTKPVQVFSFWEQVTRLFSKPVLRAALPIAVVLIVIGTLWGTGVLPGLQGDKASTGPTAAVPTSVPRVTVPPQTATPPQKSLKVTAVTDKAFYLRGERVGITLSFTNITQESLTLSNFPPYVEITRAGVLVWTFERGGHEVKLEPGETATHTVVWTLLDNEGKAVMPAVYQVAAEYITITKGSSQSTTQESYHELTPVIIEFPQKAMEKTIEVNQSQTVDGITLTLQRVELSASAMKVYVLKTPGYTPPQAGVLEPPSKKGAVDIRGMYQVDDGERLPTDSFGYRELENEIEYVWENLYPVPSDAKLLTFTITRMPIPNYYDDYGFWNFKIPLQ